MDAFTSAMGRALAFACGASRFDPESLFHRLAWELHHVVANDIVGLAIIIKRHDGSLFIGKPKESQILPPETLLGLMVEQGGPYLTCRVRDHALDAVRFIDNRFRSSIVVSIKLPAALEFGSECVIWGGLRGAACRERLESCEKMGRALAEWLDIYAPVIDAARMNNRRCGDLESQVSVLRAVVHDARAPLGIMKYSLGESGDGTLDSRAIHQELDYLEQILAQGSPQKCVSKTAPSADVALVIRRVQARFRGTMHSSAEIVVQTAYETGRAVIREVDFERVVTNLVGNAVRYAPHGRIVIEAESDENLVVVRIKDNGEGIPAHVLERALQGREVHSSGSGWGVGLMSCKAIIESAGGRFAIETGQGSGTTVSFTLARSWDCSYGDPMMMVAERRGLDRNADDAGQVFVVDDDREHGDSLARILTTRGVPATCFSSVGDLISSGMPPASCIVLCDAHMPDGGAERLLSLFLEQRDRPFIAAMSGEESDALVYRLAALGARGFFAKPVAIEEIVDWIEYARTQSSMRFTC